MVLAHTIDNMVEAAYRRGNLLSKRAGLVHDWAEFLSANQRLGKFYFAHKKAP